ncbi:FliC/FljB family flagellin [Paenalcaligenes suwonensis]|uniref:FliC/FljB family flagellin n=1 Tax=Paenalcaligenes suwonensis TaxID=1202713 RepID=UPI0014098984|nr:FliC/FljB family flagellin [Paenalcaligenes suwonensis]NHC61041.1 FliC/FljB family flagellin [Paenalcaligenes suwonensis]
MRAINSAKDDAAGQAIANRFTANVNGLSQAARNANDGISIAQTTEGSLNEINENLQRIRTLSVQAANGSNSSTDLQSIQNEINERLSEINRVSKETQFNGKYVLGEDAAKLTVQVGANDNEIINIDLKKIDSTELGLKGFSVSGLTGPITEFSNTDANGITTTAPVAFTTTAGLDGKELTLHSYKDAANATQYAVKDDSGNMYKLDASKVTPADGKVVVDIAAADLADAKAAYDADAKAGFTATANPLAALDSALQQVDDLRSHLGAIQNRFQSTISNLNNTVNNLSAARSRIEDADYAVEVSNMTRSQILQQAGTSVLAQANQIPQTVLSLLR